MPKRRDYQPQYIQHFSHDHGYFFYRTSEIQEPIPCEACGELISAAHGALYASCETCEKFMHKSCAELPQVMTNHPFHRDHPLTLVEPKEYRWNDECNACGNSCGFHFTYNCLACVDEPFTLCVKCATLVQMTHGETVREHQLCHQKIPHPHPVILCTKPFGTRGYFFNFSCGFCGLPFEDKGDTSYICVCLDCNLLLHISCADFPHEIINHPFHFQHTLTISLGTGFAWFACSACQKIWRNTLSFECFQEDCEFKLDALCASLIYENQNQITQHTVGGDAHPLIDCRISQQVYKFHTLCCLCNQPFKDSLCFCLSCNLFMHKSCAKLPDQIEHPFHKKHPLLLSSSPGRFSWDELEEFRCNACLETYLSFFYQCEHCKFRLCVRCSWPDLYPVIEDQYNHTEHPLSFFSFKPLGSTFNCGRCSHEISTPFLRCVSCDFNLHTHCLSRLPPTAKTNHLHTLNLTYLPIKDYEDEDERAEVYCDCCEERRDLLHPTYYCAECHYVAHAHCVITQVIDYYVQKAAISAEEISDMKIDTPTTNFLKSRTLLPLRIDYHDLHSQHPLALCDSLDIGQKKKYTCSACVRKCHNLSYVCHPCQFYLDLSCVALPFFRTEIKSNLHEHPLEVFNCIPLPELYCNKCHHIIFTPFFRCLKCYFTLHGNCCLAKSKHSVTTGIHWHPLTFTYFADCEFVCSYCGTKGELGDATHSCEICTPKVVAHSRCILHKDKEILHLLQELAPEGIKKLAKHSAIVEELKEKTEELRKKMEEGKEKTEELHKKMEEIKEKTEERKKKMEEVKESLAEVIASTPSSSLHQRKDEVKETSDISTDVENKVATKEIGQSIADDERVDTLFDEELIIIKISKHLAELDELKDICAQFIASTPLSSRKTQPLDPTLELQTSE